MKKIFSKKLIAVIVILIASLTYYLQKNKRQHYIDQQNAFQIEFPAKWKIRAKHAGTLVTAFNNSAGSFKDNISISKEQSDISADIYLDEFVVKKMKAQIKNFQNLKEGAYNDQDRQVLWVSFDFKHSIYNLRTIIYLFKRDNVYYRITCTAELNNFFDLKNEFEETYKSFSFEID